MTIPAYPLQWPTGWKRETHRDRARFGRKAQSSHGSWQTKRELTISDSVARVRAELQRMGIADNDMVISSNLLLRLDGLPRSGQAEPNDPGAAVYWTDRFDRSRPPRCMAIDRYDRVADNLAAIAATLEAMRAIERHGGAEILNRAFTGFTAIEDQRQPWHDVLGLPPHAPTDEVRVRYMVRRKSAHPDHGGSDDAFHTVQQAWDAFCRERGITE
ncbi:MAG: J domain-containing protein [Rhodanobacter sp.]